MSSSDQSCLSGGKFDGGTSLRANPYTIDYVTDPEPDDYLHTIEDVKVKGQHIDETGTIFTPRGLMNIGFLFILALGLLMLFAGYPILAVVMQIQETTKGGFNIGGTNSSGQVPYIPGLPSLIDPDTPRDAYTKQSADGSKILKLVYSDEFNKAGRSFVSQRLGDAKKVHSCFARSTPAMTPSGKLWTCTTGAQTTTNGTIPPPSQPRMAA